MIDFSKTDEGQFYFHLFSELGITPDQWRSMDPRDTAFLAVAFNEKNRRDSEELQRSNREHRARAMTRR